MSYDSPVASKTAHGDNDGFRTGEKRRRSEEGDGVHDDKDEDKELTKLMRGIVGHVDHKLVMGLYVDSEPQQGDKEGNADGGGDVEVKTKIEPNDDAQDVITVADSDRQHVDDDPAKSEMIDAGVVRELLKDLASEAEKYHDDGDGEVQRRKNDEVATPTEPESDCEDLNFNEWRVKNQSPMAAQECRNAARAWRGGVILDPMHLKIIIDTIFPYNNNNYHS